LATDRWERNGEKMVDSWKMAGENDEFLLASVGLSVRKFIIFDRVEEMSR